MKETRPKIKIDEAARENTSGGECVRERERGPTKCSRSPSAICHLDHGGRGRTQDDNANHKL